MKNLKMMLKFWLKLESARKNVEVSRSHICPTQAQGQGQKRKECFAPCGKGPWDPAQHRTHASAWKILIFEVEKLVSDAVS